MSELHPLRRYRNEQKITQAELAALLGTTKAAVSRWEKGRRIPRDLINIAQKTGIPAATFLEWHHMSEAAE